MANIDKCTCPLCRFARKELTVNEIAWYLKSCIETLIGTILTENGFRFKYSNSHKEFVIGGFGYYTERIIITTVANIARIRGVDFDSIILTTRVSKDGYNIPPGLFRNSDVYVDFL